jgi:hypothetical protein
MTSRRILLSAGLAALCLLPAAAQATHPRPKAAAPMRLSLVAAQSQCTAPNRTHGPPLAFPSCGPPAQTSGQATMGTPDAFGGAANFAGYFLIKVFVGVPGPPNDSDVGMNMRLDDVRCVPAGARCGDPNAAGPADYVGDTHFAFTVRLTDHWNASAPGGGIDAATVQDLPIEDSWFAPCAQTASTAAGSTCNMATSMNAFIPGVIKDTKRTQYEVDDLRIYDGGADGNGDTTADNTVFLRPGVFIP